jgi:hypothetical protein
MYCTLADRPVYQRDTRVLLETGVAEIALSPCKNAHAVPAHVQNTGACNA